MEYVLGQSLDDEEGNTLSSIDDWDSLSVDTSNIITEENNSDGINSSDEYSYRSFHVDVIANESVDNQAGSILLSPRINRNCFEDDVFESVSHSTIMYKSGRSKDENMILQDLTTAATVWM